MRIALAAVLVLSLAPAALADPPAPGPTPAAAAPAPAEHVSDDCARARAHNKTCVLDMGSETVDGNVATNTGIDTTIVPMGKYGSLINLRKDFIDKIVKTADDL
jgi:hypothetical protein